MNVFDEWFISRNLKVLDYQRDIVTNLIPNQFNNNPLPAVLAACPGAGKTIISIAISERYLVDNPNAKILVLTHGTTVLRSQYHNEIIKLAPNFTYSLIESKKDTIKNTSQVWIALPQSLKTATLPHFDLIIVDEAHHFYDAPMVQNILTKTSPKHQLLLTGTPSPFILKDYPIVSVTVEELLNQDMVSDLVIELATSTYDFTYRDYNSDLELKNNVLMGQEETNTSLDELLKKMVIRLKSVFKNEPLKFSAATLLGSGKWTTILQKLNKTLIACKSQAQAKQVEKYFLDKAINVALSISDTDVNSDEIERFKTDSDCLVLIVVGRGILGFNLPELENVIDMTTSQNIDRIFQLMCRVIRKHPDGRKKFFFRIVPHTMANYYEHIMTCVVCLTNRYYYEKFNGKNFLDMEIPVPTNNDVTNNRTNSPSEEPALLRSNSLTPSNMPSVGFIGQPAIRLFNDIIHKDHGILNSYAYVTMREIRDRLVLDREERLSKESVWASVFETV